jgi:nucleoside-diphosphate-sugar epimerase
MSTQPVALITGANGEIGRSLVERLHADGRYRIVVLDLTAVPDRVRGLCEAAYTGNILDRNLLDQIAAHHEIGAVFHLAALLSSRGERDPELAHQINVEGTLHLLRMAHDETQRRGEPVRFIFPSSIAVYGVSDLAEKSRAGRVREDQCAEPITMYGCNKLYCEHLGRTFAPCASPASSPPTPCPAAGPVISAPRCSTPRRSRRRTRASWGPRRASRSWRCPTRSARC